MIGADRHYRIRTKLRRDLSRLGHTDVVSRGSQIEIIRHGLTDRVFDGDRRSGLRDKDRTHRCECEKKAFHG